jgi:hypothetical protein
MEDDDPQRRNPGGGGVQSESNHDVAPTYFHKFQFNPKFEYVSSSFLSLFSKQAKIQRGEEYGIIVS